MKQLLCASILLVFASLPAAEVREFRNNKGQIIKAEPVVMRGMNVVLKLENKQQVPIPLKNFSPGDQAWLLQWMTWDPLALPCNFDCKPVEKAGEALRQKTTYYKYEVVPRGYEVQISNRSQSTLDGVKVAYRIFLEDRIDEKGGANLKVSYHSAMEELPRMNYNMTHTLVTRKLNCEKLTPVDGWAFYVGKITRDRLRGVWIRFYRHGVMVSEWKAQGVPKCEWPESSAEEKELAADQEAARKGAEAAARTPETPGKPLPLPPRPSALPEPPPARETEEIDEIPKELKIFELE